MSDGNPTYIGPNQYVRRDESSSTGWRAGPRSKKYSSGQIVSETYAKQVRGSINYRNRVMGLVDNPSDDTPDNYQDAQKVISEFNELSKELNKAEEQEDTQEIERIEREIDDKRASLGS